MFAIAIVLYDFQRNFMTVMIFEFAGYTLHVCTAARCTQYMPVQEPQEPRRAAALKYHSIARMQAP